MIVVDASALVAIGDEEPEAEACLAALAWNDGLVSSINYVEAGLILIGRQRLASKVQLDAWLEGLGVSVAQDENLSALAIEAYLTFGKGYHPARLNLADSFAYALAKSLDVPLLYKGNDFDLTDIRSALQPT